jgi:tetratricopeptide (TPR) repeat protein
LCRLHRGEVLCSQGKLQAAESEICRARELLAESARYAEGDAYRVLGEIRLLRGDQAGAEEAFRQAHELGWHPLPGLALLQEEKGQLDRRNQTPAKRTPISDLGRRATARDPAGSSRPHRGQGRKTAVGQAHAGRAGSCVDLRVTTGCEAAFHQAVAEVALAEHRNEEAIRSLRRALAVWLDAGSQINVAHTRLRLAAALTLTRDFDEAELEMSARKSHFRAWSACRWLTAARRNAMRSAPSAAPPEARHF